MINIINILNKFSKKNKRPNVYPVKNGIEEAKNKAKEWIVGYLK